MTARRALVTGGSGGIGGAICRRLARDGFYVIVHAHRRLDAALALATEIRAAGGQAEACAFDVAHGAETRSALERLLADGPIQVLVNNAGVHSDGVFPGLRAEQWHDVLNVSLNGFFHVTQPLMLPMLRTRWGRIISITSVSGLIGNRGQTNYAAAKGAIHMATKSLAQEVASRGVTVNAVAPGIVAAGMAAARFTPEEINRVVPMRRPGRPEEIADLVGFLASDQAAYISGQVISINGAMA